MSQIIGADLADLDRLSKKFDAARRTIEGSRDALNGPMLDIRRWVGPDSDDARTVWKNQSSVRMTEVAQMLVTFGTNLQKQVTEQRGASAGDGGLGGGVGSAAGAGIGGGSGNGSHSVSAGSAVWSDDKSGSTDLGHGVNASGTVGASALTAAAMASAGAGRTSDGAQASASASAEADLMRVHANGQVGNQYVSAAGSGEAKVDARANADGKASVGLSGAAVSAGLGGFAGGEATADGKIDLGGVTPEASASVSYGIGAHANASANINIYEIKASVDIGATLGVGAGVKLDVDVNPAEVAHNLRHIIGSIRI